MHYCQERCLLPDRFSEGNVDVEPGKNFLVLGDGSSGTEVLWCCGPSLSEKREKFKIHINAQLCKTTSFSSNIQGAILNRLFPVAKLIKFCIQEIGSFKFYGFRELDCKFDVSTDVVMT